MLITSARPWPTTAQDITQRITINLEEQLHSTSLRIYRALHTVAVEVAKARGYSSRVNQVVFHIPVEILSHALSVHRSTIYRHLPELERAGLLRQRAHYGPSRGTTRATGSLWAVKLDPARGKRARLSWEDLRHRWRDLDGDRDRGRTAWATLRQSDFPRSEVQATTLLLQWALPPRDPAPAISDCCTDYASWAGSSLYAVLDVPLAAWNERSEVVDGAARAVAANLGDDSLNFYRWLLWQLLRLRDQGQGDYFDRVLLMLQRAKADRDEGFANRAGALFVSRLKQGELWERLKEVPLVAVGVYPGRNQP